jgi:hypothetical protein
VVPADRIGANLSVHPLSTTMKQGGPDHSIHAFTSAFNIPFARKSQWFKA